MHNFSFYNYSPIERYKIRRKFKKYTDMKRAGKSDREIYLAVRADGLNNYFEILCCVCNLSYEEAKELMLCTNSGAKSLSEYQGKYILPTLEEALEIEAQESKKNEENDKHAGREKDQ